MAVRMSFDRARWRSGLALAALIAAGLTVSEPAGQARAQAQAQTWESVIVSGQGSLQSVEDAVRSAGGHIRQLLPIVDGVTAEVPAGAVAGLRSAPGVRSVAVNHRVRLLGVDPTLGYDVTGDEGSLYDVGQIMHAKDVWGKGWTGKGVDVALIDSGVAPVKGLTSGNVVNGPDLSFASQDPNLAHLDTYGHGTHMASIIAGRDQAATGSVYAKGDSHLFLGIAPDARLISLKVASSDGAADVSQVIAAIDWVTQHAQDPGFNIRVLNLSFGTDAGQDPALDPLCYAVENAWRAGVMVVVSAGNDGTKRQTLADPAIDPLVLAVGADDPQNTDSIGDDQVPPFASRGTASRHVDLITPGVHIIGLRDPGSRVDQANSSAVLNGRFFRGSGTSQSAAVASGLAALYLSRYPTATPDQVKRALMTNAVVPSSVKPIFAGVGVPDIAKALGAKPPAYVQLPTGATGTGSLEASRGSAHVSAGDADLTGEQDIFGQAWNGPAWAAASSAGRAWVDGAWNGHTWTGNDWSDVSWAGHTWTGHTWTDTDWAGHTWTGHTWTDTGWAGHTWTGHTWTDTGWDGHTWTDAGWAAVTWADSAWADASWD